MLPRSVRTRSVRPLEQSRFTRRPETFSPSTFGPIGVSASRTVSGVQIPARQESITFDKPRRQLDSLFCVRAHGFISLGGKTIHGGKSVRVGAIDHISVVEVHHRVL